MAKSTKAATPPGATLDDALKALAREGSKKIRDEMGPRYGVVAKKAFGVPMAKIKLVAKSIGTDRALAAALWKSGWYEARLLASMIDDADAVTAAQMDRWAKDFDNWGVCDTVCFLLFDQSPHAPAKALQWARRKGEFEKRGGFALLACLALHGRADDAYFLRSLAFIEDAAGDDRNFVKKGVSWALRAIGGRSAALNAAALRLARRLSESGEASARWIGKDALKDLKSPATARRLKARARKEKP
jgi:3-methyladenine DNA glycosylase AlkD